MASRCGANETMKINKKPSTVPGEAHFVPSRDVATTVHMELIDGLGGVC